MINLVSLYPDRLNLNGDQANLTVLTRRLEARAVPFRKIDFGPQDSLEILTQANFILIGHGSMAAWASLRGDLSRVNETLHQMFEGGCAMLAVGSGAEFLYSAGWFEADLEQRPRISKFAVEQFEDIRVLGYLNSATNLPVIQRTNNLVLTGLHGPVLAKNPQLADRILARAGVAANQLVRNQAIDELDAMVAPIWELEVALANQ